MTDNDDDDDDDNDDDNVRPECGVGDSWTMRQSETLKTRTMVSECGQCMVTNVTGMVKQQTSQTAITLIMMTEPRQSVVSY